jgi:pimeloyl-ACP methyl ester carboxylesterase
VVDGGTAAGRGAQGAPEALRLDDGWELLEGGSDDPDRRVLLLPANMATAEFFRGMVTDPALVGAGVRAVAATPPGFGGRPAPPGFDFTLESYGELIAERAASGRFDLVLGHSLSANALIEVAARGRYEGGLVLVAPTLRASSEVQAARNLNRLSRLPIISGAAWIGMMLGLRVGMRDQLPEDRLDELVAEMRRNPTRLHRRWLTATFDQMAGDDDLAHTLATASNRAWLVRGAQDPVEVESDDRATLEASGISVTEIPDAGHFVVAQRPHEVNAVVLEALASLD